jgi:transcription elongation factor GreA
MADNQIYLTKEGLEKLRKELEELKSVKRKEIAKRIEEAKELGDLSENAEYASAREEQALIEDRIVELENIIRGATVIEEPKDSSQVELGSVVRVEIDGQTKELSIVGTQEIDPLQGKISHQSPLGRALLGKRAGEEGEVEAPKGKIKFKIISIS